VHAEPAPAPVVAAEPEPIAPAPEPPIDSPAAAPLPAAAPDAGTSQSDSSPPAASRPLVVVLAFQQDCWVETRIDGGRRTSELRAGGETLILEADESIVLTLGNAPAVRAELNGRPLAFPVDASRLLREFRIDRSTLTVPPVAGEPRQPAPGAGAPGEPRPERPSAR
jgi:hypothetical protein